MHVEKVSHEVFLISFTRKIYSLYFKSCGKKKPCLDNKHECNGEQSVRDAMRLITGLTGLSFKLLTELSPNRRKNSWEIETYELIDESRK